MLNFLYQDYSLEALYKNFFRKKLSNSDLNIFSIKKLKNDTGFNPTTDCFKIKIDNNCR